MSHVSLTDQSLKKTFAKYTSLGILSMLGVSLFILADTFFIANGVGPEGIAALNIVLPMINVYNGLGWMLGVGGATLYSIAKGRGYLEQGQKNFSLTIVVALLVSVLFSSITLLFSDPILRFLGASGSIFEMSKSYYMIVMVFSPLFILNNVIITFLRNDSNPKLAMTGLLVGGLFNIVLDYIFIFPFGWGLTGAAIATAVSPLVSLIISTFHLRNKERNLAFLRFSFQFRKIKDIFSIGFSSFLNEFSSALVMFLFNIVILQLIGSIGVSAYGIIANMNIVVIAIFTGIGQGFQPLVSHYYGARKTETVRKVLKYALVTSLVAGILFFGVGFFFSDVIVSLFNNEQNQALAQLAEEGLVLYFISFIFTGINFATIYFMSAIEKARPSYVISLLRGVLLIVPILIVMANTMELTGVWLTMPIVEVLTFFVAIVILIRYTKYYLKN